MVAVMAAAAEAVAVTRSEEATSGFAMIVEQFLTQSLEDSEDRRQQARRLRGRIAMTAEDYDQAVTLVFEEQRISILEGPVAPLDASIRGPYETLVDLIQGDDSPLLAHLRGRVRVRSSLKKPLFPLHVHNLMKLDKEEEAGEANLFAGVREAAIAGVAVVIAVAALMYAI
jgi:putative sterol carrier protein